jgi:hypothetical protein
MPSIEIAGRKIGPEHEPYVICEVSGNPNRSLAEQCDLLRMVDNDRFPAFFDYRGRGYVLRIAPEDSDTGPKEKE